LPGILDSYLMGFPSLQTAASPLQPLELARLPQRPQPDLSAAHALAGMLAPPIQPPVPLVHIPLPSLHPMNLAQAMQAANAVAAGKSQFFTPIGQGQ
jgi:hypothetical protein